MLRSSPDTVTIAVIETGVPILVKTRWLIDGFPFGGLVKREAPEYGRGKLDPSSKIYRCCMNANFIEIASDQILHADSHHGPASERCNRSSQRGTEPLFKESVHAFMRLRERIVPIPGRTGVHHDRFAGPPN